MELLEWLTQGFELLLKWLKAMGAPDWIEHLQTVIVGVLFLAAVLLIYQEFAKCFLLLRRMNPNKRRGGFREVLGSVLRLAFTDRALLSLDRRTLARRTRILVEHELFRPKPQPDWRHGGHDPERAAVEPSDVEVADLARHGPPEREPSHGTEIGRCRLG